MIQKGRVNRLSNSIIPTKRKRHITNSTTYFSVWQVRLYPFGSFKKVNSISLMLLHTGSHRKYVRIENNILCREPNFFSKYIICAPTYIYPALQGVCLAPFIKSHYNGGSAIFLDLQGMLLKYFFAFF